MLENNRLSIMAQNILAVYDTGTLKQKMAGVTWYGNARIEAQLIARQILNDDTQLGEMIAIAIIAALSPQKEWNLNVKLARQAITELNADEDLTVGHFKVLLQKVKDLFDVYIRAKSTSFEVSEIDMLIKNILNGLKITAFYQNIRGLEFVVTVDGHAANIADYGLNRKSITEVAHHGKIRQRAYDTYSAAYREAGAHAGLTPAEIQCTTWLIYRDMEVGNV